MANQAEPVIDAIQDFTLEKVILSGAPFVSAILGPGAYRITADSAPVFYRNPVITGLVVPPSVLTCEMGSFNSSPRATPTYQWKKDTVNITNQTSNTYTTVLSDFEATITCEVTITNSSGSDTALSNGILIGEVEEGYVFEMDVMTFNGIASYGRIDVNYGDISIIMGLEHHMKVDCNEAGIHAVTGIFCIEKADCNEADLYACTGVSGLGKVDVDEADSYVVTGASSDDNAATNTTDAYTIFLPINLTPLVVLNGDAENVSMADWTMDTGGVTSVTSAPGSSTAHREGARFFMPDDLGQGVDSQMSQEITIPAGDLTDVDTGRCYCISSFIYNSNEDYDKLVITLEALDAGSGILSTSTYTTGPNSDNIWLRVRAVESALHLPTLTRTVKITILFDAHATLGSDPNSVYIDDISIDLMKIA